MRTLHVAAAQIHSGFGIPETLRRIERQMAMASLAGAEVILFAEGALHGYDYDLTAESVRAMAEPPDGPNVKQIAGMAAKYAITALVGFFERDGEKIFNSVLIAPPDQPCRSGRKYCLTPGEIAAGLTPGPKERPVVELKGVRCALVICADAGLDGLQEDLRQQGVEYRFCPAGGGGKIGDMLHESDLVTEAGQTKYREHRVQVFKTDAILDEKDCLYTGFTAVNALGPVGRQTCHQGHCMIVDNHRVMRAQIPGTIVLEHMQDQMIHALLCFP